MVTFKCRWRVIPELSAQSFRRDEHANSSLLIDQTNIFVFLHTFSLRIAPSVWRNPHEGSLAIDLEPSSIMLNRNGIFHESSVEHWK